MNRSCLWLLLILYWISPSKGEAQEVRSRQNPSVKAINYNNDKSLMGWVHWNPNEVRIINIDTSFSINIGSESGGIKCFAFHPTKKSIAIGFYNGTLELWEVTRAHLIWSRKTHEGQINDLKFSSDGDFIVTCSTDKTIRLSWSGDGSFIKKYRHSSQVNAVEFHPLYPSVFVTGDHEGNIVYWKVNWPEKIQVINAHKSYILDLVFYKSGDRFLSASHDKLIKAWDFTTGKELKEFKEHTRAVYTIDISDDGKTFTSGSFDKKVCVWNYQSGKATKCFTGHSDYINVVRYTPDEYIVSGSRDGTVRRWKN